MSTAMYRAGLEGQCTSASRNLSIPSRRGPNNRPEYSEILYLSGNHCSAQPHPGSSKEVSPAVGFYEPGALQRQGGTCSDRRRPAVGACLHPTTGATTGASSTSLCFCCESHCDHLTFAEVSNLAFFFCTAHH